MLKKIIVMALCFILCIGTASFSVSAANIEVSDSSVLYRIGITDEESSDSVRFPTRAEAAKAAVRLIGAGGEAVGVQTIFEDVSKDNEFSGYINYALNLGIISEAHKFSPENIIKYEEFIKMIVCALGYSELADNQGGYPTGHLTVASNLGLNKGVRVNGNAALSMSDFNTILTNALYSELAQTMYYISADGIKTAYVNTSGSRETVLSKVFNVKICNIKIKNINYDEGTVEADILSVKHGSSSDLKAGNNVILTVSDRLSAGDYVHLEAEAWITDDDVLVNVIPDKKIEVINGYLDEVNKEHNVNVGNDPRQIKNIAIVGHEDYIDVSESCEFYYNDKLVQSGKVMFAGSYVRAVVKNDEVILLEAYDLQEGGIITEVDLNDILYSRGSSTGLKLDNFNSYKDLSVIINDEKSEKYGLMPDMVFDYYADGDYNKLLIVASSKAVTDEFRAYTSNAIFLGEHEYELSKDYDIYVSADGEVFNSAYNLSDAVGGLVTAYLDYAGFVRFVEKTFYDENNAEFYAIITGYKEVSGLSDGKIKFIRLYSDKVKEFECELSEKINWNSVGNDVADETLSRKERAIESILRRIASVKGAEDPNTAIKNTGILYKIKLNASGKVSYVNYPTPFDEDKGSGFSLASTFSSNVSAFAYDSATGINIEFDGTPIYIAYYDGGFKVDMLDWSTQLRKMSGVGLRLDFFSDEGAQEPDCLLIRGDINLIWDGHPDNIKLGLLTEKNVAYDKEADETKVELVVDGKNYIVTEEVAASVDLPSFFFYGKTIDLNKKNQIVIDTARHWSLKGTPDTWKSSGSMTNGLLASGTVEKTEDRRLCLDNGVRDYYTTTCKFYRVISTDGTAKFIEAEKNDLYEGAKVWYIGRSTSAIGQIYVVFIIE